MSKRLEEIKQYLKHFHNAVDVEDYIKAYIFNTLKVEWLIEQAERLQELRKRYLILTKENNQVNDELIDEFRKNKRYREALKEILTLEKYNETDNFWDNDDDFYMYIQNTAEKALEGDLE